MCTSGCGEYLVRTQLARNLSEHLFPSEEIPNAVDRYIKENFFQSPYLSHIQDKLVGVLVLQRNQQNQFGELVWAHSSEAMAVGWSFFEDSDHSRTTTKALVSRLEDVSLIGKKTVMNGFSFS